MVRSMDFSLRGDWQLGLHQCMSENVCVHFLVVTVGEENSSFLGSLAGLIIKLM